VAERQRRARHRRADRDGDPSEVVLRRLARARAPREHGWVPSPPAAAPIEPLEPLVPAALEPASADPGPPAAAARSSGAARRAALADRLPLTLRGAVLRPSAGAVAGLGVLLLAAVAVAGALLWWSRPTGTPVPLVRREPPAGTSVAGGLPPPSHGASPAPSGAVVVHVAGAVRRPGLVELPGGARVSDAVEAAGGATRKADLTSVNLARPLVDGEQLLVLRRGQAGGPVAGAAGPPGGAGGPAGPAGAPIDLNTATLQQLDGLPGVGPVLAQRIIDWRTEHGRFATVDELTEVSGIGERTLADLRSAVRV
jgi:competence protein ComEA